MAYREVRSIERCCGCGSENHVVVCYSAHPTLDEPEAEYCFACGETIKTATCLAIFTAASPDLLDRTVSAFKSGQLCSSLQPPPGVR